MLFYMHKTGKMSKIAINTDNAPSAIGTYSQAIINGELIFISGQIPFDPQKNSMVEGDRATQVHRTFQNLANIAESSGSSLDNCLKLTIFLLDLKDFDLINTIMKYLKIKTQI